ncbi:hypothetical protein QFZ83_000421 [Variovorax sp. W1I1]|uniref:hypothetical protein n=1 Tax=Variovorax sp. W1I1 TaxID=3042309 RepID=UPI00277EECBA|nr:hypothetical protein [Variovorax sp. W1I1]MDQ0606250.1 hypothetical protein [Variovorax sp. W1I1]
MIIPMAHGAPVYDYSTPEKALTSLENALTAKDIEAAVRSKAFMKEAEGMAIERLKERATREIIESLSRSLEMSYRLEIKKAGFPNFAALKCSAKHELLGPDVAVLSERCIFPDQGHSVQRLKAYRIGTEWKIGEPLP